MEDKNLFPAYIGFGKLMPETIVETENEISADYYFLDKPVHQLKCCKEQSYWFMYDIVNGKHGMSSSAGKLEHLAVNHFRGLHCDDNPVFQHVCRTVCDKGNIYFEYLSSFIHNEPVICFHPAGRMLVLHLPILYDKDFQRREEFIKEHISELEKTRTPGIRLLKSYRSSLFIRRKDKSEDVTSFLMLELMVPLAFVYEAVDFLGSNDLICKEKIFRMIIRDASKTTNHDATQLFPGMEEDEYECYCIFLKGTNTSDAGFELFKKRQIEGMAKAERVALYLYRHPEMYISVDAYFEKEELVIDGYDHGKPVEEAFGDSDYEYLIIIESKNVSLLYRLLDVTTNNRPALLRAIALRFNGDGCFSKFADFLKEDRVDFKYSSY